MIKKINIFLVLLLLVVSIGAVSAADDGNMTELSSNGAIQDTVSVSIDKDISYSSNSSEDVVAIEKDYEIGASSHTITEDNYNQYFSSVDGKAISSKINSGDTVLLDGSFSGKTFIFDKTVNVAGTSTNSLKNSMISLLSGASGSSIANLNIANTNAETYGIFLNSASNCTVSNCIINNTGRSSYCICLANGANYNNVTDNNLKAYGITYGHGSFTRSTPPLILSGSHYNYVANNHVEADDANGIYLSSYSGGPLKGGDSNYNTIFNNTVHYNVLPTSWAYGIQVMGGKNIIKSNTVIGGYRGVSTAGVGNTIIDNMIINLTGADYNNPGVESGGEYGIVASYNSLVSNNHIIGAKVISTGAGITALDDSVVENNGVNVTDKGRGIVASGSNVIIRNNVIFTESGSGVYQKDEGSGLLVDGNNITSVSGVGILIEKLSSKRMPKNVTVVNNVIYTNNKYAIDASGVQEDTSEIDVESNKIIGGGLINSPAGVIDSSKPTYIYKGTVHTITPENIREYINDNGGLTSEINDTDILNFKGTFSNEVIYVTKAVKITGQNPIFYNSTFKVTSGNVLIENLTIINKKAERVNAWGIFVNQAPGVRIMNNHITVSDPKAAYAIYLLQSSDIDVINNVLISEGDYLTFTLLSYACEECIFANNTIRTTGTGESYQFSPEKCIDGNELVINGRSYCLDGNELVIDGKSYCLDGNELVIDGNRYCVDGNEYCMDGAHVVSEIYQTYGILLLYSSNNIISGNDVNVTSKLADQQSTTGNKSSQNSLVGIDLYFNCHNNTISNNNVLVKSKDNYIYGMGVLGYYTGHSAPQGQGATNNAFIGNQITLDGIYCVEGIIIGDESEDTSVEGNVINIDSDAAAYGIYFEMSQKSTVKNNNLTLNSQAIYGIEGYGSSDNVVWNNIVNANGKDVYGVIFVNGNKNSIKDNKINANGNGEDLTVRILDSIGTGNAGIYLMSNSTENYIEENEVTSKKGYAILLDNEAIENVIADNYLDCEKGIGNKAVSNTENNNVSGNYKYVANPKVNEINVPYRGTANIVITLGNDLNGATVDFYDVDGVFVSQSTVSGGIATIEYKLDESYAPAQYPFTAKVSKEDYKSETIDVPVTVSNGNIVIDVPYVSIQQGDSGNITATVVDEFGNKINGAVVQFNRLNSAGRATPMGTAVVENGVATLNYAVPVSLEGGNHTITAVVSGVENYNDANTASTLEVIQKPLLTGGKNYSVYYGNTVKYKVRALDVDGKPVSGQYVYFKLSNGKSKKVKTTTNGYATYSIKLKAGTYTIKATFDGYTTSNKIVFKPTLTAKNISKKKAKTTKFTVKLVNKNGKILKNKKITFKMKNKKYTAKTNNKGIATLSLKNLKVGKYTITSSYGGCTISNKITIKK
ncbi:right-handed parallel beta-helix repeat-containing protein [Methanobrevibacter sp.]|uniref:right-handed parallel beta-helix repeat-containing protein n=1 Tax=Methanobrevibacter sp. TaxID=66852 RepID=UPI0038663FB9